MVRRQAGSVDAARWLFARRVTYGLLANERRLADLPDEIRLARAVGVFAVIAALTGALAAPFIGIDIPIGAWWTLGLASVAGAALLVLPEGMLRPIPSWSIASLAMGAQTSYVMFSGATESPYLAGFTAIVLLVAATSKLRVTAAAVAFATIGLLVVALADARLEAREIARLAIETTVLLVVATTVSRLAWRRRVALHRMSRRLATVRSVAARDRRASRTDKLTGLGNRRAFDDDLARITNDPAADSTCLLVADIDGLKQVNDRFGHPTGDSAIRAVANAFRGALRSDERIYRLGGDEFAAILSATDANAVVRRLAGSIRANVDGIGSVTAAVGVASAATYGDPETLVRKADEDMYAAKERRRGERPTGA